MRNSVWESEAGKAAILGKYQELLGRWPGRSPEARVRPQPLPIELAEYLLLIPRHFSPRLESIPPLSDYELRRLSMPVHYVAGDLDALLSTGRSAARLRRLVPHARVDVLPDVVMDIAARLESFLMP